MADRNPWAAETWNVTDQMAYLTRYGLARAKARAADAGRLFSDPPLQPPPKRRFLEATYKFTRVIEE